MSIKKYKNNLQFTFMKTKQILLTMLMLLSINNWSVNAQEDKKVTVYYYITRYGEDLQMFYTDVCSVERDENNRWYSTDIEVEFTDAIKLAYPKTYFKYKGTSVWLFDKASDAEKDKREKLGKYKSDNWETSYFRFTFYGDK